PDHDYITIWGYWRGLEDTEACSDVPRWAAIDAAQACRARMLSMQQQSEILTCQATALARAGYEDLNLRGEHIILSYRPGGSFKTDPSGRIELGHCNFEFIWKLDEPTFSVYSTTACAKETRERGARQAGWQAAE